MQTKAAETKRQAIGQSKEKDKHFGISDYLLQSVCFLSIVEPRTFKTGHEIWMLTAQDCDRAPQDKDFHTCQEPSFAHVLLTAFI
jgi:hypothetical protein